MLGHLRFKKSQDSQHFLRPHQLVICDRFRPSCGHSKLGLIVRDRKVLKHMGQTAVALLIVGCGTWGAYERAAFFVKSSTLRKRIRIAACVIGLFLSVLIITLLS
ncbi:MAG: hypothetical protein JWO15_111 [Sphingomonadales bacterium]|nr:hypothetical protein [Sphingomonadales bacterium]